jgi:hypothetical protein
MDLPLSEVSNRIAALPNDTAVYYSAIYAAGQDSSLILRE